MSEIEVVRSASWFEPHECWGDICEDKASDSLGFLGGESFCVLSDNHEVKEIVFALELVSVFGESSAEIVCFDADVEEGEVMLVCRKGCENGAGENYGCV